MLSPTLEKKIEQSFQKRCALLGAFGKQLEQELAAACEEQADAGVRAQLAVCLQYLYAQMPVSDCVNVPFSCILDYAAHGVYLWEHSPYVDKSGEEDFLQYVLFHRVNDEEIRPCRKLFFAQLAEEIKGKSAYDAALAVNYWCARNASYQSTDDRTMSALGVYESAAGRCGEESTFLTNALRSCGLMARQVYAPKWSHCDDNHAWVEVYADGRWQFLGACEPEEILNKGWFISAASRAIVIESRRFAAQEYGTYQTDAADAAQYPVWETAHDGVMTACNQLARYAHTKELTVCVTDADNLPLEGAQVEVQIVNYATFATVACVKTDAAGSAKLTLGRGSVWLRVTKDARVAECLVAPEQEGTISVVLGAEACADAAWQPFDMLAPVDAPLYTGALTPEQKARGKEKFQEANEQRIKKSVAYENPVLAAFLNGTSDAAQEYGADEKALRAQFAALLSPKDRRDVQAGILEEHFSYGLRFVPREAAPQREIFFQYVWNPRIQNEPLSSYRAFFTAYFSAEQQSAFQKEPKSIWAWIQAHIACADAESYSKLVTEPAACLRAQLASAHSQRILFVAIARTFGIPARLRREDDAMEYLPAGAASEKEFVTVCPEEAKTAVLRILSEDVRVRWSYSENWSVSRLENGTYRTLVLDGTAHEQQLPAGAYRIVTANRLPNGNIFAKKRDVSLRAGETTTVELSLREAALEDMLESIQLRPFTLERADGRTVAASELMRDEKKIFLFLEEGKEPTEHILNELMEQPEFAAYGSRISFIVRTPQALSDPTIRKCMEAIAGIEVFYDDLTDLIQMLGRAIYVDPDKLPLILVTDAEGRSIYGTSGYNVGTAAMLLRILQ